jgi:hypothetical protein
MKLGERVEVLLLGEEMMLSCTKPTKGVGPLDGDDDDDDDDEGVLSRDAVGPDVDDVNVPLLEGANVAVVGFNGLMG